MLTMNGSITIDPTTVTGKYLRYNSSLNINPSAKGTGRVYPLVISIRWC